MKLTKEYLQTLDSKSSYILICKTPVALPLSFLTHMYILTVRNNEINRYEVLGIRKKYMLERGCVFKNDLKPWQGMLKIFLGDIRRDGGRFTSNLIKSFDVKDIDNIDKLIDRVEKRYLEYPYRYSYKYRGPNSNTFISWLLADMELEVDLPWNPFGKGYKMKKR